MSYIQKKLSNGIPVILSPQKSTQAVSVLVMAQVGSRQEQDHNNGVAHFVEHLLFKGTEKRPNTQIISHELDAIGADYNAYTSKDRTGYYIKAEKTNLPLLIDLLSDMTTNSLFVPEEIERERGTILEEINMYEDNPMAQIDTLFEEDFYGAGTPLGRHIIGSPQTIKNMTREDLVGYWKKHYTASNLLVSIAGSFSEKKALQLLEKAFGNIPKGKKNTVPTSKKVKIAAGYTAHYKKTNQAHVMLGFSGVTYTNKDRYAAALLAIILGGNMSSRLFIQVRERLGLCYFIRASSDSYQDAGTITIQAGLDMKKVDKALEAISIELADLKKNGVKSDELEKAKAYLKGKMALSHEDSLDVASFYASQALFQKSIKTVSDVEKKIDAVKPKDMQRLARMIFQKKSAHLVTLSPFKDIKSFAKNVKF